METVIGTGVFGRPRKMLFALWVFLMLNYLYCDVLSLFDPEILKGIVDGTGPANMDAGKLMAASVLMEIPMAMILLTLLLPFKAGRIANIAAGIFLILVQIGSWFVGSGPSIYYIFFSAIEISACIFIVWYSWTRKDKEAWL